ncbi:hypothetical protein [Sphingobium sp. DC-2]|uniref:hypothetical protein n=1 Tax=Sphingobium sp. DC-2 TaxID=1303256 RepID=UPI0004C31973|nr:hypothetical protein [Sphingobium sp. DC-2]
MTALQLTEQDKASIAYVSDTLGMAFISAGNAALTPICSNPSVSPIALLLGLVQAHVNGLASALGQLNEPTRDRLIAGVPAQLATLMQGAANERG